MTKRKRTFAFIQFDENNITEFVCTSCVKDFALQRGMCMNVFYMSFVDPKIEATIPADERKPGGASWLGACIVEAHDIDVAITTSHRLGINPGGAVAIYGPFKRSNFKDDYVNRLLKTMQECEDAHI